VERYKKNVLKEKYFPQFDRVAFNLAFLNLSFKVNMK